MKFSLCPKNNFLLLSHWINLQEWLIFSFWDLFQLFELSKYNIYLHSSHVIGVSMGEQTRLHLSFLLGVQRMQELCGKYGGSFFTLMSSDWYPEDDVLLCCIKADNHEIITHKIFYLLSGSGHIADFVSQQQFTGTFSLDEASFRDRSISVAWIVII